MQQSKPSFVNVPINKGTQPDWNVRFGYPSLFNLFVGRSGFVYSTPALAILGANSPIKNVRSFKYTNFNGGSYIVVTDNVIYRLSLNGTTYSIIAMISFSGLAVQMDENIQNQVIIVDGKKGYVVDQRNNSFVTLNQTDNGFGLTNPISVVVINTITIVLDGATNGWIISETNNALTYPALDTIPTIESQLTQAISLETINNNLYIFGLTGIERWEPNYNVNQFLFPFQRDNNFRTDFGAISTNGVIRGAAGTLTKIYFLSSQFVPMVLTENGITPIPPDSNTTGMSRILSQYADVSECITSFSTRSGYYFVYFTFLQTGISWVYCDNSQTWSQGDDLITAALPDNEVVGTPDGVFEYTFGRQHKHRQLRCERITDYKGLMPNRGLLNGVEAKIIQGQLQSIEPQYLNLTISTDSITWTNTVPRTLGRTGEFNSVVRFPTNIAAPEFTFKFDYYGDLDLAFEKVTAIIQ